MKYRVYVNETRGFTFEVDVDHKNQASHTALCMYEALDGAPVNWGDWVEQDIMAVEEVRE